MDIPENNIPQPTVPAAPVSKRKYIAALATPKTKLKAKIAWIVALVCVMVMVIGYIFALNTSFEDIPIASMVLSSTGDADSFEDMKEDAADAVEGLEDIIDEHEDELEDSLSEQELKAVDRLLDVFKAYAKTMSISNTQKVAKSMKQFADLDIPQFNDYNDSLKEMDEAVKILSTVSTVLMWMMIISLLFTVLGALFRANGWVVFGAIFTTIYCIIFCGVLFVILNLAAHIGLFVLHSQIKKEYKAYRAGTLAA